LKFGIPHKKCEKIYFDKIPCTVHKINFNHAFRDMIHILWWTNVFEATFNIFVHISPSIFYKIGQHFDISELALFVVNHIVGLQLLSDFWLKYIMQRSSVVCLFL
jgi:hypothetical protein